MKYKYNIEINFYKKILNIYISHNDCHCNIFSGDENYDMNYVDVPLEKSFLRYKRATILSPMTNLVDMIGTGSNSLIKTILHFFKFITAFLIGQEGLCPTEKLSIERLIEKMLQHPTEATEIIFCFIFNTIGQETRLVSSTLFETMSEFLRTIFLPGLHMTLNEIAKISILPANIRALINAFNVFYDFLRIIKYVK